MSRALLILSVGLVPGLALAYTTTAGGPPNVPEPSVAALMAVGAAGALLVSKLKKK